MKFALLFRSFLFLGLTGLSGSLHAAESGPVLRFMSWETAVTDLFILVGKELKPLYIPAYNISSSVVLPLGTLEVRLAKKMVNPEGVQTTVSVAQALLPEGATGALVVLLPAVTADQASGPRLLVFPDSPADFPAKSVRVINLSGNSSAVRIGGDDYNVPFSQTKITPLKLDHLGRCLVTAAVSEAGNWKIVYKDMLSPQPNQRVTLLLVYSPTGAGTSMSYDEMQAGGKRASTQFALVLFDDVIGGKLEGRAPPDPNDQGGVVTPDRMLNPN